VRENKKIYVERERERERVQKNICRKRERKKYREIGRGREKDEGNMAFA